jgi:hypothetical protein
MWTGTRCMPARRELGLAEVRFESLAQWLLRAGEADQFAGARGRR